MTYTINHSTCTMQHTAMQQAACSMHDTIGCMLHDALMHDGTYKLARQVDPSIRKILGLNVAADHGQHTMMTRARCGCC